MVHRSLKFDTPVSVVLSEDQKDVKQTSTIIFPPDFYTRLKLENYVLTVDS